MNLGWMFFQNLLQTGPTRGHGTAVSPGATHRAGPTVLEPRLDSWFLHPEAEATQRGDLSPGEG